jgi:hypothetical protein
MLLIRLLIRARSVPGAFGPLTRHPQAYSPYTPRPPNSLAEGISERFQKNSGRRTGLLGGAPAPRSHHTLDNNRYIVKPFWTIPRAGPAADAQGFATPDGPQDGSLRGSETRSLRPAGALAFCPILKAQLSSACPISRSYIPTFVERVGNVVADQKHRSESGFSKYNIAIANAVRAS